MNGQYLVVNGSFLYKGLNSRLRCFLKEISTFTLPDQFLLYDRNHYRCFEISSVQFVKICLDVFTTEVYYIVSVLLLIHSHPISSRKNINFITKKDLFDLSMYYLNNHYRFETT